MNVTLELRFCQVGGGCSDNYEYDYVYIYYVSIIGVELRCEVIA